MKGDLAFDLRRAENPDVLLNGFLTLNRILTLNGFLTLNRILTELSVCRETGSGKIDANRM